MSIRCLKNALEGDIIVFAAGNYVVTKKYIDPTPSYGYVEAKKVSKLGPNNTVISTSNYPINIMQYHVSIINKIIKAKHVNRMF